MDIALYVISTTGGRYGNCIICNIQIQAALGIALYVISSLTAGVGHCIICNTHIGHSGSRRILRLVDIALYVISIRVCRLTLPAWYTVAKQSGAMPSLGGSAYDLPCTLPFYPSAEGLSRQQASPAADRAYAYIHIFIPFPLLSLSLSASSPTSHIRLICRLYPGGGGVPTFLQIPVLSGV